MLNSEVINLICYTKSKVLQPYRIVFKIMIESNTWISISKL